MSQGEPVTPERLTPEQVAELHTQPVRTVRAKSLDPVPAAEVQRAKVRGFMLGAALAAGAGVAAAVGYLFIKRRKPSRRHRNA